MIFPKWVSKVRGKEAQASARLRYMLHKIAIERSDLCSIRGLCQSEGVSSHTLVSHYIARGAFSQSLGERFEAHFGSDIITADQLVNPMGIKLTAPAQAQAKK